MPRSKTSKFVLVIAVLFSAACQKHADAIPEVTTTAPTSGASEPAPPEVACGVDGQCDKFLRCLDGVCTIPPAITGTVRADTPIASFYNGENQVAQVFLEVADDVDEQRRGLMFRTEMKENWGMIFVYDYDDTHQFWMKNTLIPLDMLFIGADGVVQGIVTDVPPLTLTGRGIEKPSRHVLELTAGACARLGIKAGSRMRLENAPNIPLTH